MKMKIGITTFVFITAMLTVQSICIQAQVSESWVSRYDGPGSGTDKSNAITVDKDGNVYVTGSSNSAGAGTEDYVTIKYSSAGSQIWLKRINGTGGSLDIAYAIAIDTSGCSIVTGGSIGIGTNYDYLTIKFSPEGDTIWTRRYNGPKSSKDVAYAIALDDTGNIYITGESEGLTSTHGIFEDYATIKYSKDGVLKWVARYNGPAGDYDRANAITIDESGNVYVTGTSDGGSSGSGDPHFDYATLKYNNSGIIQWVKTYNRSNGDDEAKSVKVDMLGNIFVTGLSPSVVSDFDYLTIKYNSTGDTLWTRSYNGPADGPDNANDLKVDDLGNVYVTGSSYGGLATNYDYATIKYNSGGETVWANRYNGSDSDIDEGGFIALDKFNNVYVSGRSTESGSFDYATVKYNTSGDEDWVIRYSNRGAVGSSDEPSSLYVDTLLNVYVTGMSALDYATVKYVQTASSVENFNQIIPERFLLEQCYPNPFNPSTKIRYSLPEVSFATLKVYDVLGNEVATLVNEEQNAGNYEVDFFASGLSSGIYFYTINAGSFVETKKMLLMK